MFWFGKNDNRSVEQIIFDIAEQGRRSDIKVLVAKFAGKPIFAPISENMKEVAVNKQGKTYKADGSDKFLWHFVKTRNLEPIPIIAAPTKNRQLRREKHQNILAVFPSGQRAAGIFSGAMKKFFRLGIAERSC